MTIENTTPALLRQTRGEQVWELRLNRPARKNALSLALYQALTEAIGDFSQSEARVLILAGEGGIFTSGNDLQDFATQSPQTPLEAQPVWQFMQALRHCPKPVLVAAEGLAYGIGTTLLLHVDGAFATESTRFCMPFAKLGLTPEYASSLLLPARAGWMQAAYWLYTGAEFDGPAALAAGLVLTLTQDPLQAARDYALQLAAMPPEAQRRTKALLRRAEASQVDAILRDEAACFAEGLAGDEFQQAVKAFFSKT